MTTTPNTTSERIAPPALTGFDRLPVADLRNWLDTAADQLDLRWNPDLGEFGDYEGDDADAWAMVEAVAMDLIIVRGGR